MKCSLLACSGLILLLATAHPASAQILGSSAANPCPPVDHICSLAATGVAPLTGSAQDGQPASALGFLIFGEAGAVTGTLEINVNGTVITETNTAGTCTSGTGNKPGVIQVTAKGVTITYNFVVARSFATFDLLLSDHTSRPTPNTPVELGVCHASNAA